MLIECPKCGCPGSLNAYHPGHRQPAKHFHIEHRTSQGLRFWHHINREQALAILAATQPLTKEYVEEWRNSVRPHSKTSNNSIERPSPP